MTPRTADVPELLATVERVTRARDAYLADLPISRIVTLLDRVGSRWLDPSSHYRREAERRLPSITGYSEPAVRKGLASLLGLLRRENLERLIEREVDDPRLLDEFRLHGRGAGLTRAFGPRLVVHIWSGNVPGLPMQSLINATLVKSASIGKVASEEPLFAQLFLESISEVDPRLADCFAVLSWKGGNHDLERAAFDRADAVIAYGSAAAMEAIRAQVPRTTRLIEYGHKLSFGVVCREALTQAGAAETAARAAYDVAKYDQQGCLSPHVFYVETGGEVSPQSFSRLVGDQLAACQETVPRGELTLEERVASAQVRQSYELIQSAGSSVQVAASPGAWTVIYTADPTFQASCLNRTIFVKPVGDAAVEVPTLVSPARHYLQTCGVAAEMANLRRLAEQLGRAGLDRICPLGRMADVAPEWHHDGHFNLLELLRWTDLEPDGSAGRWEFAHPLDGLYGREKENL